MAWSHSRGRACAASARGRGARAAAGRADTTRRRLCGVKRARTRPFPSAHATHTTHGTHASTTARFAICDGLRSHQRGRGHRQVHAVSPRGHHKRGCGPAQCMRATTVQSRRRCGSPRPGTSGYFQHRRRPGSARELTAMASAAIDEHARPRANDEASTRAAGRTRPHAECC